MIEGFYFNVFHFHLEAAPAEAHLVGFAVWLHLGIWSADFEDEVWSVFLRARSSKSLNCVHSPFEGLLSLNPHLPPFSRPHSSFPSLLLFSASFLKCASGRCTSCRSCSLFVCLYYYLFLFLFKSMIKPCKNEILVVAVGYTGPSISVLGIPMADLAWTKSTFSPTSSTAVSRFSIFPARCLTLM